MLECLIMGDSIAVGTHMFKKECVSYSEGGINSWQYNKQYGQRDLTAETVIISLGSNDHKGVKTYNELYALRQKVIGKRVYWVLPNPEVFPKQADDVNLIAISFGDQVIQTKRYQANKVHPSWAGYKQIADAAK